MVYGRNLLTDINPGQERAVAWLAGLFLIAHAVVDLAIWATTATTGAAVRSLPLLAHHAPCRRGPTPRRRHRSHLRPPRSSSPSTVSARRPTPKGHPGSRRRCPLSLRLTVGSFHRWLTVMSSSTS